MKRVAIYIRVISGTPNALIWNRPAALVSASQEPRQPLALLKRVGRRCPLAPIAVTKEAAS